MSATFSLKYFTVTINQPSNGKISVYNNFDSSTHTSTFSAAYGSVIRTTVSANTGYSFGSLTINGTSQSNNGNYTIVANTTISAVININYYTVSCTQPANGSLRYSYGGSEHSSGSVPYNGSVQVIARANSGYSVSAVYKNGSSIGNNSKTNITGNTTFTANMSAVTQSYNVEKYHMSSYSKQYVGNRYMNNNPLSTFVIYAYRVVSYGTFFADADFCLVFNTSQSFNTAKFTLTNFPICTAARVNRYDQEISVTDSVTYGQTVSFTIQKNGLEWHDSSDDGWNESTIGWGTCIDGSPYDIGPNPKTMQTPQNISISTNPKNLSIGKILYLGLLKLNNDNTNFNLQTVLS